MAYAHLRFGKEAPLTERHRKRNPGVRPPADPRGHGAALAASLQAVFESPAAEIPGFDDRTLLKITLREGEGLPDFDAIPGVEILSQEDKTLVLAFASAAALELIETRLATLARDGAVTRKQLLFAIQDFDRWTPEERTGPALAEQGMPQMPMFVLDVELWPQQRQDRRDQILQAFEDWIQQQGCERLDVIKQASLIMVRVRCSPGQARSILQHRDVRMVDLPPRHGLAVQLLLTDINAFPPVNPPASDAPFIAVLDSGLTPGHSLLGPAVGDAQGYSKPLRSPNDTDPWHGTFVAGLALYGDIETRIRQQEFLPTLRLLSCKVFNDDGTDQTEFVENAVEFAVRDMHHNYGCSIFNLSYGDFNRVYDGRHIRGLAYTLDRLARELGILFVVPTGNLQLNELPPDAHADYPHYLLQDKARLLDPATALNVLTVGGLARHEATQNAQRYPQHIEDVLLARRDQPFPLGRSGFSVKGAVKPDLVEYAGNLALRRNGGGTTHAGLGVVSMNGGFAAQGAAFKEDIGTSYAAPQLANKAANLLAELPGASSHLLRALLGVHAQWPMACRELLHPETSELREQLLRLIGYGQVDEVALYRSLDNTVTLLAEDSLACDQHHFYELPLPARFWSRGRRGRVISVGLAYSPAVRTTRLEYRESRLSFTLVTAESLADVAAAFRRGRDQGMKERTNGRWLANDTRKSATLQVSRWTFRQPLAQGQKVFVVLTRQDNSWSGSKEHPEPYGLAVVLDDREQAENYLYAQVQAQLVARVQEQARVRV